MDEGGLSDHHGWLPFAGRAGRIRPQGLADGSADHRAGRAGNGLPEAGLRLSDGDGLDGAAASATARARLTAYSASLPARKIAAIRSSPAWSIPSNRAGVGLSRSRTPMTAPSRIRGTTSSDRDAESQAM